MWQVEQLGRINAAGHETADGTGDKLWPTCVALCRHLCAHAQLVRGRRVVELGSGAGGAGIVCAALGAAQVHGALHGAASAAARDLLLSMTLPPEHASSPRAAPPCSARAGASRLPSSKGAPIARRAVAQVVLTDMPEALPLLRRNAARSPQLPLSVEPCTWGSAAHIAALRGACAGGFDLVLACEVMYKQPPEVPPPRAHGAPAVHTAASADGVLPSTRVRTAQVQLTSHGIISPPSYCTMAGARAAGGHAGRARASGRARARRVRRTGEPPAVSHRWTARRAVTGTSSAARCWRTCRTSTRSNTGAARRQHTI